MVDEEAVLAVAEEILTEVVLVVALEILVVEEMEQRIDKSWKLATTAGKVGHQRKRCPKLYDMTAQLVAHMAYASGG